MSKLAGATIDTIGVAASAREAITKALAHVGQPHVLNALLSAPDQPQPWDAWPRWTLTSYTGGRLSYIAVHEYDALVVLPAGYEPDTVEKGDSVLDHVAAVLRLVGRVEVAEPIRLTFDNGTSIPALRVHVVPHLNANHNAQQHRQEN